jgi:hypothetical protein
MALICTIGSIAQTTNISGVVNSYYEVIEYIPAKNCMRVTNPAGLSPAFKILIVQMKGASITTNNDASYGAITSLNDAGNYEVAYVCYVNGDSVFMVHTLLNSYTNGAKVQIVKFADYVNAVVTDSLKAQPWNNTTGTGGVIALTVLDNLFLNGHISADGVGFKGGDYVDTGDNCTSILTGYVFNAAAAQQNGAYKGEGVHNTIVATSNGGRGAPANGGGGGNNHNNSGGGGANLTAGGIGGGNSSSTGCIASFRGEAGKPLNSNSGTKIFFGGGGGAGHNNGGLTPSHGGNGGGIIFIDADTIISNGRTISARGTAGGGGTSDGSGGGGAGGTIILKVNQYTGAASITVTGGKGGDGDNNGNNQRCYAGGGGGSAGVIYYQGAIPTGTINIAGGIAGGDLERAANCNASVPAGVGGVGSTVPGYTIRRSTTFHTTCGLSLPSRLAYFKAKLVNKTVQLTWRSLNPEFINYFIVERFNAANGWKQLATINANDNQEIYSYIDREPLAGDNLYRIKIVEKNLSNYYSPSRLILIAEQPGAFSIYPNPASDKITVTGNFNNGADLFLLDINGKQLMQRKIISNITDLPLPVLPKGIYMVRIGEATQKLVIQ